MEKHKFNFFPPMSPDDAEALRSSIAKGFDPSLGKIMLFEDKVLDGWNRYLACVETGIEPIFDEFVGTEQDAFNYSIRANQDRRHLTKSQLAAIAIDAEPLWQAIQESVEAERRRKISEARQRAEAEKGNGVKKETGPLIDQSQNDYKEQDKYKTNTKLANSFGVGRQYIADAKNLKENNPEAFEAVKNGEKTITEVKREEKSEEKARQKSELMQKAQSIVFSKDESSTPIERGKWYDAGPHKIYCGSNMDDAFINQLPKDFDFAFADPPYNEDLAAWDSGFTWEADYLSDIAKIIAVTPGIRVIPQFMAATKMPYRWSMAAHITNGMTRGALGFGNWVYIALFSDMESIHRNAQDVLKVNISTSENAGHYHKGRKPSHLMLQLVELFTLPGGAVLDPFLGSGSTLFACEKTGRICYGAEISPEYVSLILSNYGKNCI